MKRNELEEKYPWLVKVNTIGDYLPPEYYQHLLKPYTFGGISDLSLLEKFLHDKEPSRVLELGCGSGRASGVVTSAVSTADYTFSDLSERMLEAAKQHLPAESSFVISDAIEYMENAKDQYDLVYTIWSFSHSTHQHIHRLGIKKAEDYISSVIKKFIRENIVKDGSFFLIHFDSLSQEQSILMRQWKRVFPAFANIEEQSPSKQIIDKILLELDTKGEITLSINHLQGDSIHYKSEDEVLETFMNFHLETYFNNSPLAESVIDDIKGQISKYRNEDGSYDILPGCYVYSFIKNCKLTMKILQKLQKGDKVAVLSPSFAAPAIFPKVFDLGLQRIRGEFGLEPVEYPTTRKLNASAEDRARDLIAAFSDPEIKAVIASTGGDDQVIYIHKMPPEVFLNNPKPFLGYSDSSHFCNFLFQHRIPSYYGACVMTQFAMQGEMDRYTVENIRHALFDSGEYEINSSEEYNEIGLNWKDETLLTTKRTYEKNMGWVWDAPIDGEGILWGGCLESIDDMLRNNVPIPSFKEFENIVLMLETSEEIPSHGYVRRVIRALGERGVLLNIQGVLMGRPKAWEFDKQYIKEERTTYTKGQQEAIIETIRFYNKNIPIVQNMNFGHTDPQIPMPYGGKVRVDSNKRKIFVCF